VSTNTDEAKPAVGAEQIHKAEREAREGKAIKLGGRIGDAMKEIIQLHNEIETAFGEAYIAARRVSLPKAVRLGELLTRVHESRGFKGKWLEWLENNMPFSQPMAWRYMECYRRRDELKLFIMNNSAGANPELTITGFLALLPPKRRRTKADASADVAELNVVETGGSADADTELASQPHSQKRHKLHKQIMRELQAISDQEQEIEKQTNVQLAEIIATLNNKVRAQWLELPTHLRSHGEALVKLSERLALNTPHT